MVAIKHETGKERINYYRLAMHSLFALTLVAIAFGRHQEPPTKINPVASIALNT